MITVLTSFTLPAETTPELARQIFVSSAPRFLRMPGLRYKFFLLTEDGRTGMGFYIWDDRQHAEAFFTEEWMQSMHGKYGSQPTVTYLECVVEVDNLTGGIRLT
jgi:heme-degrading monooxygenase HmoA